MRLLLVFFCFTLSVTAKAELPSHAVLEFGPVAKSDISQFQTFAEEHNIDFLSHPNSEIPFYGLLNAQSKEAVIVQAEALFHSSTKEVTEEVTEALKKSNADNEKVRFSMKKYRSTTFAAYFKYYPTLSEINDWMVNLTQTYPGVSLSTIGSSYEGRPLKVLKINTGKNLPIIFVESTIHCREWLSPATTIYMISKILSGSAKDMFSKYELQFSLVTNPDGYKYTHDYKTTLGGRFWRKNRRPINGGQCFGVDLNRNFDIRFGTVGVSHDCSASTYCGPKAYSEPETDALNNYVTAIAKSVKMYLAIHTFGQMIIVPHAYSTDRPKNDAYFRNLGYAAADAFKRVGGRQFHVGNTQELGLGLVSGSVVDWALDRLNISAVFALELQPRGVGAFSGGFNPPASAIIPSGEETFAAFTTMISNLR